MFRDSMRILFSNVVSTLHQGFSLLQAFETIFKIMLKGLFKRIAIASLKGKKPLLIYAFLKN